ncbi:hypothetical protein [Thermoanaerobacter thermocopriae]|nr:hypothetical protein [Thermoanaerobacter thermocopriae]
MSKAAKKLCMTQPSIT